MDLNPPPPSSSLSSGFSNFPILAIALLAIMVTGLLLVTYYIVVIKCCLNWQTRLPPPLRPRGARGPRVDDSSSWLAFSASPTNTNRGLDEVVLRDIPTLKYKAKSSRFGGSSKRIGERSFRGCAVCLSEFEDQEMLRVLPHCGHVFHLDCIDIWLLNNANCPLCRSTITGAAPKRAPLNHIVAPSSSPQEIIPIHNTQTTATARGSDGNKGRIRNLHGSIMGDECIVRDEEFLNQPIRRSFSMDSVTDRRLLLQVQQIIRQNRLISNEGSASSSGNRSIRRSFFSFGQGQGSKTSILPI